ncbi:hypothetical protein [Paenibacillus aceris]|uniref:Spore germination protein n=1 Tax=Paenibacillus aceris TaxID=869555 RepID=A0ABS4I9H9_9BACL|nr:hypothetical protein [Paenibacillus aceris]MBP1967587.1 hypothetical protein [Paenibacillus aceris]NHW39153.1 hypothetical protein [Paenibacillus aceris]
MQKAAFPALPLDPPLIQFDAIHVNAISDGSGIFIGTNMQVYWATSSKSNSGLGEVSGENNYVVNNFNTVHDNDIIDAPYTKGDLIIGRV